MTESKVDVASRTLAEVTFPEPMTSSHCADSSDLTFPVVSRYAFVDTLNGLPELTIEVVDLAEGDASDVLALVGRHAEVSFPGEPVMQGFGGIVRRVEERTDGSATGRVHELTIVPFAWLTRERSGHRIFQERNALEILGDVLAPYGEGMEVPIAVILERV